MIAGRVALALALAGPPLAGAIALVASVLRFRAGRARPAILAAVSALVIWTVLCVGATILGVQAGFAYAWMWAHARLQGLPPVTLGDELEALGFIGGGLLVLSGCAVVLHSLVRRTAHSI